MHQNLSGSAAAYSAPADLLVALMGWGRWREGWRGGEWLGRREGKGSREREGEGGQGREWVGEREWMSEGQRGEALSVMEISYFSHWPRPSGYHVLNFRITNCNIFKIMQVWFCVGHSVNVEQKTLLSGVRASVAQLSLWRPEARHWMAPPPLPLLPFPSLPIPPLPSPPFPPFLPSLPFLRQAAGALSWTRPPEPGGHTGQAHCTEWLMPLCHRGRPLAEMSMTKTHRKSENISQLTGLLHREYLSRQMPTV